MLIPIQDPQRKVNGPLFWWEISRDVSRPAGKTAQEKAVSRSLSSSVPSALKSLCIEVRYRSRDLSEIELCSPAKKSKGLLERGTDIQRAANFFWLVDFTSVQVTERDLGPCDRPRWQLGLGTRSLRQEYTLGKSKLRSERNRLDLFLTSIIWYRNLKVTLWKVKVGIDFGNTKAFECFAARIRLQDSKCSKNIYLTFKDQRT